MPDQSPSAPAPSAQIGQVCAVRLMPIIEPLLIPNGGSRATAATSNRHAPRLVFQRAGKPSAESVLKVSRVQLLCMGPISAIPARDARFSSKGFG